MMTYNLRTDAELEQILAGCRDSLEELAPYNGTAPGAAAIAETRRQMELVQAEIDRRGNLCGSKHARFDLTCTGSRNHAPGLHHNARHGVWWE